jgi:hypothetical protein
MGGPSCVYSRTFSDGLPQTQQIGGMLNLRRVMIVFGIQLSKDLQAKS